MAMPRPLVVEWPFPDINFWVSLMGRIGLGYGSEWHLLRMLGRHREFFTRRVLAVTGGDQVSWEDFAFTKGIGEVDNYGDAEPKGLSFLPPTHETVQAWKDWWPQSGNAQNWDAVGRLRQTNGAEEWLLVEAKANIPEIWNERGCGAGEKSRERITRAIRETQEVCGVTGNDEWLGGYYQYANRLAVLNFLNKNGVPARLLFLYFTGDCRSGVECPSNEAGWMSALATMKRTLGLTGTSALEKRVHQLFLPVVG